MPGLTQVVGRFAPSPTGDLHFGSLVSAVGSCLEARNSDGKWLLRIEDIDPPREVAGCAIRIIHDLQRLGLVPDEPTLFQSTRLDAYQNAVDRLLESGFAYPCGCSRKDLPASGIYPGTCRKGLRNKEARSIRFRVDSGNSGFEDKLRGPVTATLAETCGDFVIRRADGLFAYQLAVVVDDDFQAVTQVVRGADLLDSTLRQISLQRALGLVSPEYMHLPVVLSAEGTKLSKRLQSDPVRDRDPAVTLEQVLHFLGHNPPPALTLELLWDWALSHWNHELVPRTNTTLPTLS